MNHYFGMGDRVRVDEKVREHNRQEENWEDEYLNSSHPLLGGLILLSAHSKEHINDEAHPIPFSSIRETIQNPDAIYKRDVAQKVDYHLIKNEVSRPVDGYPVRTSVKLTRGSDKWVVGSAFHTKKKIPGEKIWEKKDDGT